jgi:hypothetical protein
LWVGWEAATLGRAAGAPSAARSRAVAASIRVPWPPAPPPSPTTAVVAVVAVAVAAVAGGGGGSAGGKNFGGRPARIESESAVDWPAGVRWGRTRDSQPCQCGKVEIYSHASVGR